MEVGFLLSDPPVASLEDYLARGGGVGLARVRSMEPDDVIDEIRDSGLRGRGGAGFPTGRKWAAVRQGGGQHRYVVCNGAEGEPATFKDRALLRANPYLVVEGLAVAALTLGAREAFLGLKASFVDEMARVTRAVEELQAAGLAGDVPITVVGGPE